MFKRRRSIGLNTGGKARAKLHAVCPHLVQIGNILPCEDASSRKDGDLHRRTNIGDDISYRLICTEVSACFLSFDDNCRCTKLFGNLGKLCRRDDRNNRRTGLLAKLEHIAGEPRTGDYEVNALVNRNFNSISEVACGDHLIDANNPIGRE